MWNFLELQCPSEDMCMYGEQDADLIRELSDLATLLTSSAESLTQDDPVWEEVKVFQNVQAKYKQMLHCDKCLVYLQRVGGCLRKMVILNLSKSFLDLGEVIIKGLKNKGFQTFFPSKQQVQYILIRCMTAAKLVLQSLQYSKKAFYYLVEKLNIGHLPLHLIMALSVTARVNILFKSILANLFTIYRKLYPWVDKLKIGRHEWPQNLNLPEDLENWLGPEEDLLSPGHIQKDKLEVLTKLFSKKEKDPSEADSDSVVELNSDDESMIECVLKKNRSASNPKNASETMDDQEVKTLEDVGEVILRETDESESETKTCPNLKLTPKQRMLVKKINSAKSIKRIKVIWNHLNVSNPDLLPKALTPSEIRIVEKMLSRHKRQIVELKSAPIDKKSKLTKKSLIVKLAAKKLIKHLGLSKPTLVPENKAISLEPIYTFVELKKLYRTLYDKLQSQQKYDKCEELDKVFRSRKEEIKLLKKRNENVVIENLIFCTSKVLFALYEK